jgi:hypothetical protein
MGSITMETTAYRPSAESSALDFDRITTDPQAMPYHLARADLSPYDPVPLFLSDPESEPDPAEFAPVRARTSVATRIVASALAASAIAVLAALFHADVSRLVVVNAKAWMDGPAMAQTSIPLARPIPLKDPARVSNPTQLASANAGDLGASAAPSREAIANAYQTALQAQPPVQATAAAQPLPPTPAAPARTLDADTLSGLMTRAKSLMAVGDIAAARLLLERAANGQEAAAAFLLAQTYDPAVLGTKDTRSITADPATARDWYRKAAQLGSTEAQQRLSELPN